MPDALLGLSIPSEEPSFIDGKPVRGDGPPRLVIYPGDESQVSTLIEAGAAEVDAAVMAARRSFESGVWARRSVEQRQEVLRRIAELILNHAEELAQLEVLNAGLPIAHVRGMHMPRSAYNFRFFAEVIGQATDQVITQNPTYLTYVERDPVGVAALIAPWNAPTALATMKMAAALAFGNSLVLKPSEQTPLALYRIIELMHEAGLPDGVVNLVNGRGPVTGAALSAHPEVDVISFTGGGAAGAAIGEAAGRSFKPVTMELGGKSANIIFESADLDRALDGALVGIFSNNGQQCLAGSRILVQKSIAEEFMARFVERAQRIRVGDPMDPETVMGPLSSAAHRDKVLGYVDVATGEGGRLLTGGRRHPDFAKGFYVEPTAVLAPSNEARICQEEVFGPLASFLTFEAPEDAIRIANASSFGLVAYLWSKDVTTVLSGARALRAGTIWVNTPMMRELRAPFGGYKASGVWREGALECRDFYTEKKTVSIPVEDFPLPQWGT